MSAGKDILVEKALAWKNFQHSGEINSDFISGSIAESWKKCAINGVQPTNGKGRLVLEQGMYRQLLKQNEVLIHTAKPFMQTLYKIFRGTSFVVVLTDAQGYILENFGDYDRLKKARELNFLPGANWKEDGVGTNAIGAVLSMGEPIQVSGAEHYCLQHHCWTCSAAPITGEKGEIVAVLDVSGAALASSSHTLGMVVAAAEAISMQLKMQRKNNELILANKRLNIIFNSMSEGVMLIDQTGIIHEVNAIARRILEKSNEEVIGHPVNKILGDHNANAKHILNVGVPYSDLEFIVSHKRGACHCLASGEPLLNDAGDAGGGVIILRPIKQVRSLVNRFSGNYAAFQFSDIIGQSPKLREAVRLATKAASSMANVLLQGESGTGKELFAQAIHHGSSRKEGPFIAVNCGAIPRELIGSELFGYEEGAFTGARRGGRPGKFELASGGTLFLDEIGDMPLEQQVALLRALQEKNIIRIGSARVLPTNVRVIGATNKNLAHEVERGTFRLDLYYRLNVISITVPPLRERGDDILLMFRKLLDKIGEQRGCQYVTEPEVLDFLLKYHWPGNVRELHNVAERATSMADGNHISMWQLPPEMCKLQERLFEQGGLSFNQSVKLVSLREQTKQQATDKERELILSFLKESGGNISLVAKRLGVARSTLYRKIHSYSAGPG